MEFRRQQDAGPLWMLFGGATFAQQDTTLSLPLTPPATNSTPTTVDVLKDRLGVDQQVLDGIG